MRLSTLLALAVALAAQTPTAHAQNFAAPSIVETIFATDGFGARTVNVQSGAEISDNPIAADCGGVIETTAHVHFAYTSGAHALSVSAQSQSPVTLLIADPRGRWSCETASDGRADISFDAPLSGRYAIWVGAPSQRDATTITIEEHDRPSADQLLHE